MDLRVIRTRTNITNAFIELRSKKPLERITVKELADAAFINKATFYQHYRDIYDLSDSLETELIENIIRSIPHPDTLIDDPGRAALEITEAMTAQTVLLNTLFSGSRQNAMVTRLEDSIRALVLKKHPEYAGDLYKEILLTYLIHGSFHAFFKYNGKGIPDAIRIIAEISGHLSPEKLGYPVE